MEIIICGARDQGRVVLDTLKNNKEVKVIGFIDDVNIFKKDVIKGVRFLGDTSVINQQKKSTKFVVTLGDIKERARIFNIIKKSGFGFFSAVHPSAVISEDAELGENVQINAGAIVGVDAKIGNNVIVNTAASVDHDNLIGSNVNIGPGAHLAGRVTVKDNVFIGAGVVIIDEITIGENSVIGAGSVVIRNVPANTKVAGVPAVPIKGD